MEVGIDTELAVDIEKNFTWTPPLAVQTSDNDDILAGPEGITPEEIEAAFDELERENVANGATVVDFQLDGQEILAGKVYDFEELESVDKGIAPATFNDDVQVIGSDSEDDLSWDPQSMLIAKGVSSS
jgi:hypothetical protein